MNGLTEGMAALDTTNMETEEEEDVDNNYTILADHTSTPPPALAPAIFNSNQVNFSELPNISANITMTDTTKRLMVNVKNVMESVQSQEMAKYLREQMHDVCPDFMILPETEEIIQETVRKPKTLTGKWNVHHTAKHAMQRKVAAEHDHKKELIKYYKLIGFNRRWVNHKNPTEPVLEASFQGGLLEHYQEHEPDGTVQTPDTLFGLLAACAPIVNKQNSTLTDETGSPIPDKAEQRCTIDFIVSLPHHTPLLIKKMKEVMQQSEKCHALEHKVLVLTMQITFWQIYTRFLQTLDQKQKQDQFQHAIAGSVDIYSDWNF